MGFFKRKKNSDKGNAGEKERTFEQTSPVVQDKGGVKGKELTLEQASPMVRSMIEKANYPYRIFSDQMSLEEMMEQYEKAVEKGKEEGYVPVLVPEDDILDEYFDILRDENEYTVEGVISRVGDDGAQILARRFEEYTEPEEDDPGNYLDEILGEMENGEKLELLISMSDFGNEGVKETILFEVPTKNPWEVVAYVPFGGWNECPEVEDMTAVCKYWYEKYGAVPAAITHDTLEFVLPKPVPEEEAMEVAKEHFAFSCDRVYQCTATSVIGEVADSIRQSRIWYFWWD